MENKEIEHLFRNHFSKLVIFATGYVHDRFLSEDIVQETFIKYWDYQKKHSIDNPLSFLYNSVRNASIDYLRKNTHELLLEDKHLDHKIYNSNSKLEYEQLLNTYQKALDVLPPKCREAYLLSRNQNMKYHEIALCMNISEKTVEMHISKSLKILRVKLADYLLLFIFLFVR